MEIPGQARDEEGFFTLRDYIAVLLRLLCVLEDIPITLSQFLLFSMLKSKSLKRELAQQAQAFQL